MAQAPSPRPTGERPFVLHVSGDFPDPLDDAKTPVIKRLVDLVSDRFDHEVVSINRRTPNLGRMARTLLRPGRLPVDSGPFEYGTALIYSAPPRGIRHATALSQLGEWLARHIGRMERKPDLLVGHKLTIEGIAVAEAARMCGLPYALSIQGNSDAKILDVRRDLAGTFRAVLDGAGYVFPFSPWGWKHVAKRLGTTETPYAILPCPTDLDQPLAPRVTGSGLVTVFHLHGYRHKNFANLARAMERLGENAPSLRVIGGGSDADVAACARIAAGAPSISLAGGKDRAGVRAAMNEASGFVLPSRRDTFGLVFVEALFAGTPIIYPAGTAVDGLFDGLPFALRVPAGDANAIAEAIRTVIRDEADLKRQLKAWQTSDHAAQFQRPQIADTFAEGLRTAMGSTDPA